ncbi:hypothetical protein ATANTOWER_029310 [Ataeniobius toweri]|uniref:Uncharacterized protein n=1 Tax=Ataeniobius toweri TaxID=208326 RepID=A0ABU7B970_9TELE|nr:hypothetical protein [Ataeniobius toweri]
MSTSSGKRKSSGKPTGAEDASAASNALIDTCHDYAASADTPRLSLMDDENFPPLPVTPEKPPNKKGKSNAAGADIVATLSKLINNRSDDLKSLIQDNTVQITSLRGNVEALCNQMSEVKGKVSQLELALDKEKKRFSTLDLRNTDMERYS